jgi:D-glycero-D-manno-heptose 1,7-bisphosphate phosphatase
MRKAVFLDRDGIINTELGDYIMNFGEFEIHPPLIPFLKEVKKRGYLTIVITNQGGIAKKLYGHDLVEQCHQYLQQVLTADDLAFDAIYYCPHHPQSGACLCRKPAGLLIEKAIASFQLEKSQCLMIGDKQRDVDAAHAAGISGYLLPPNPDVELLLNCLNHHA